MTKIITSLSRGNFGVGWGDGGSDELRFSISIISTSLLLDDLSKPVVDKPSGIGMFTCISINNTRYIIPLLQNSLVLILGFFASFRRVMLNLCLFWSSKIFFCTFFGAVLLVACLTIIVSSIWDCRNGLCLVSPGSLAIDIAEKRFLERVKKKTLKLGLRCQEIQNSQ